MIGLIFQVAKQAPSARVVDARMPDNQFAIKEKAKLLQLPSDFTLDELTIGEAKIRRVCTMVESNIKFDHSIRERCVQWGMHYIERGCQTSSRSQLIRFKVYTRDARKQHC